MSDFYCFSVTVISFFSHGVSETDSLSHSTVRYEKIQSLHLFNSFFLCCSGRSTRAYKVAGVTLLACTLILSQALLAYFLLSQKDDIKSLKDQNNKLSVELSKPRSAGE